MSEKRFEAKPSQELPGGWFVHDNQLAFPEMFAHFGPNYPGGTEVAAKAEAARLNAWWEAGQAKKEWRVSVAYGSRWIVDSSGMLRINCYSAQIGAGGDPALAERVCRLLNEDEARTK